MRYVILRDDDTCAFTPPEFLERLYRPFLGRGMPVNLAVIPEVRTDVRAADGRLEGFLSAGRGPRGSLATMGQAPALVGLLNSEPGFRVVQHGCHHDMFEFGVTDRDEIARRLDRGAEALGHGREIDLRPPRIEDDMIAVGHEPRGLRVVDERPELREAPAQGGARVVGAVPEKVA